MRWVTTTTDTMRASSWQEQAEGVDAKDESRGGLQPQTERRLVHAHEPPGSAATKKKLCHDCSMLTVAAV